MALATKATRGAVAGNSWTSAASATVSDNTYATAAPAKNGTVSGDWDFAAFSDAEIPAGATINSVTIRAEFKVSTTSSVATLQSHCINNGTDVNSSNNTAEPTADTNFDVAFTTTPTETDVKTAGRIVARIVAQRGNSNTAVTFSLDYVELRVDYSTFTAITPSQVNSSASLTAALVQTKAISPSQVSGATVISVGLVQTKHIAPSQVNSSAAVSASVTTGQTVSISLSQINSRASMTAGVVQTKSVIPATIHSTASFVASVNIAGSGHGQDDCDKYAETSHLPLHIWF